MPHYFLPVQSQLSMLDQWTKQACEAYDSRPPGILNLHQSHGSIQYLYKSRSDERSPTYLSKNRLSFITDLAQKNYEERFLRIAEQQKKELLKLQSKDLHRSASVLYRALASSYESLSPERKKLVTPYVLPDDLFIEAWLQQAYERKAFFADDPLIITNRGERVRSRIEKIMADTMYRLKIPYLYEFPLSLFASKTINPDFTILDIRERTTVIFEHFGLMGDLTYNQNANMKIEQYLQAGFIPGYDFLYTQESGYRNFNPYLFESLIKDRFL